jgi:radical SAM protein with 4Fe4S-binding SPASM domain
MLTRIANRLRLFSDYLLGRTTLRGRPMHLTLESTNKCNLACPMCNRELDPLPRGHMTLHLFRSIIDQCRSTLEFIWPFGEGEPLLNEHIYDMVSYARKSGIHVEISTNATLLDETRSRHLLASGADNIILAFDGATPGSYEKYRAGARFEDVKHRIEQFLRLKIQMRSRARVILQMVLLRDNQNEVEQFRRMWTRPGVDALRFKEDQLKYESLRANIYKPQTAQRRAPCYLLWRGPLFIRHDGTVSPCCRFQGRPPLGDLKRQTFDEIWNSEKLQALRRAHVTGDLTAFEPCRDCTIPRPTRLFTLGVLLINPLTVSRLLPYVERLHLAGRVRAFQDSYGAR